MKAKSPRFNQQQSRAIACLLNAVVVAGAGSGKTTVLAQRYLSLLRQGRAEIDEILCLTFTRKAAAQLNEKIHHLLCQYRDEEHIGRQLEKFDLAQIATLDSFCAHLTRGEATAYGLTSDFMVDSEPDSGLIEQWAGEFSLKKRANTILRDLIADYGAERVIEQVFVQTAKNDLSLTEESAFLAAANKQIAYFSKQAIRYLDDLSQIIAAVGDLRPTTPAAAKTAALVAKKNPAALWQTKDWAGFDKSLEEISGFRMPGAGAKDADTQSLRSLLAEGRRKIDLLRPLAASLSEQEKIINLARLLDEFAEFTVERKKSVNLLHFSDLTDLAITALRDNTELRRLYKKRFKFIMIDEFQDNNQKQKDLLYLLAEKNDQTASQIPRVSDLQAGKLFFVGDQKQSIYQFRGADVQVFKNLAGEVAGHGGESITLNRNYRSHPALIDFFNRIFKNLMPETGAGFEAEFQPLIAGPKKWPSQARIKLFYAPFRDAKDENVTEAEGQAYFLAQFIKKTVTGQKLCVSDGNSGQRPAQYSDFALLLRSSGNQVYYERFLRGFNIPYQSEDSRGLFLEAPANDLHNLIQLAVYPEDRLAYAAVLRGPFANLDDPATIEILNRQEPPFAACAELSETNAQKYRQAGAAYDYLNRALDREPLSEVLFNLIYGFGYRYLLLARPDLRNYHEFFDYLIAMADQADAMSLCAGQFLDLWRENLGQYKRLESLEIDRPAERRGVRITTIHKAKGLEFPIVLVADLGNTGRRNQAGGPLLYIDKEYGPTLRSPKFKNPLYEQKKQEGEKREIAELKRLLYVALTRAENHLFLFGRHHRNNRGSRFCLLNLLLIGLRGPDVCRESVDTGVIIDKLIENENLIEEIPLFDQSEIRACLSGRDELKPPDSTAYQGKIEPFSRLSRCLCTVTDLARSASGIGDRSSPALALPGCSQDEEIKEKGLEEYFGQLCHSLIEAEISRRPYTVAAELTAALTAEGLRKVIDDAQILAANFIHSDFAKRLTDDAPGKQSEIEFLFRCPFDLEEGKIKPFIRGKIDLLVENQAEVFIVDFKSDRHKSPVDHFPQIHLYQMVAQKLLARPVNAYLFYLRSGQAVKAPPLPGVDWLEKIVKNFFKTTSETDTSIIELFRN